MLKSQHWIPHSLYQKKLLNSLKLLLNSYRDRIEEYSCLIDRLFYLNLDNAYKVLSPYYSNTGRPAKFQAEILRSLIAMVQLRIYSTNNRYDLPIHFILPHLYRHDSVSAVIALSQLKTIYPEYNFSYFVADSAHDNLATYHLCNHYNLSPIIELNPKN
ncbi:hypothetical protein H5T89_09770, partial [bacterium]|nr:hypothetical protein [bacterium]